VVEATVTIQDPMGLHARPVGTFVKLARSFKSTVTIQNATVPGKVVAAQAFAILSLGVKHGHAITINVDGPDEDLALKALVDLVERDFAV
jgi:phosphocarrier protein HPr